MRTYSKLIKIEDTENCRLCLNTIHNGFDIFENCAICIEELLASSLNIIVSKKDGLPSKICKDCYEFLIKLSSFKAQCKTADEWLQQNRSAKGSELEISSTASNTQLIIEDFQSNSNVIEKNNISSDKEPETNKLSCKLSSSIQEKKEIHVYIVHEWEDANLVSATPECDPEIGLTNFSSKASKCLDKSSKDIQSLGDKQKPVKNACPTCKKPFLSRYAMLRHLRLHSGEKKYICTICGRKFAQQVVLKRHSLLHTKTKPLSCDVCGKGFIQKSNLNTHKRTHLESDALNFPCGLCDKVFKFASGRSRHILLHKGVRYSCNVCSKVMNDLSSFNRHKKRHVEKKQIL